MQLTLAAALAIIDVCISKAEEISRPMSVAVCDAGGHVVATVRMDDCMLLAGETVTAKARAAVYFRRPTSETVERSRHHSTVYGSFIEVSTAPIVLSMGGIPLYGAGGEMVGAVAAAGGSGEEDVVVASAGEKVWLEWLGSSKR